MRTIQCSVDHCEHESTVDIYPEGDQRAFLCTSHFEQTNREAWTVFKVNGRDLLLDSAGSWWFIPERDDRLHDLARKAELI